LSSGRRYYSHSIVLSYGNALNFHRKFFLHAVKDRLTDSSENCALDFKREFQRFKICSISATIGIDRSTSRFFSRTFRISLGGKRPSRLARA
jgi:hypothetical protein